MQITVKFSMEKIQESLKTLSGWEYSNGEITRTYEFRSFSDAIRFVNKVAQAAEEAQHHPDFEIHYTKVRLNLMSHFAAGITEKDIELAHTCNQIADSII